MEINPWHNNNIIICVYINIIHRKSSHYTTSKILKILEKLKLSIKIWRRFLFQWHSCSFCLSSQLVSIFFVLSLILYMYPTIYFIKKTNKIVLTGVSMSNIPAVEGGEIKLNVPCDTTATCEQKSSCPGERMVIRCVNNFCQCNWWSFHTFSSICF